MIKRVKRKEENGIQRDREGSLLVELLWVTTIFLFIGYTLSGMIPYHGKEMGIAMPLQQILGDLRRLQQHDLYGYSGTDMQSDTLAVSEGKIWQFHRGKATVTYTFPIGIQPSVGYRAFSFTGIGLPQQDTNFALRDSKAGQSATIYIGVQTGRIRSEI